MKSSLRVRMKQAATAARKLSFLGLICTGAIWSDATLAGNTTYQYDSLGRIIKVIYPDSKQICYAYDSAGNRTQVKRQATGTCIVTSPTVTSSALIAETAQNAETSALIQDTSGSNTGTATDSALDDTGQGN